VLQDDGSVCDSTAVRDTADAQRDITLDPAVTGGKPCIRGMRVTVGMVVGMVASGHDQGEILALYPDP
jgi:uncharacterized protein (DUF433 family)